MMTNPLIGVLVEELANSKRMLKGYRRALEALPKGRTAESKKAARRKVRYVALIAELEEQIVFIRRALHQRRRRGTTLAEYLAVEMRDPEYRRLYDEASIGLRVAREIVRAREAAKMTQDELARALKTKRQTISRIEVDAKHVTIKTLGCIARALKCVLEIRIVAVRGGRSYGAMSKEGP